MTTPLNTQILLVEDNPGDVKIVQCILAEFSLGELSQAPSLAKGLALMETFTFDIVLLDLGLPDSEGLTTFTDMHARFPEIPVLIFTGINDESLGILAVQSGAQDYLVKPQLQPWTLARSVRFALERNRLNLARNRAEASMRESDKRFRHLLETVPLFALTLDPSGRITFCNQCLLERAGMAPDQILGQDWFTLFTPPGLQRRHWFEESLAHGEISVRTETDLLLSSGEVRRVIWHNTTLHDPSGRVLGTASIGEDVTDRRRIEAALKGSEAKYRLLVERLHEGLATTDPEGHFTFFNPRLLQMLGYEEGELAALDPLILNAQPQEGGCMERRERPRPGFRGLYEARLRRKDGTPLDVLISECPMGDEAPSPQHSLVLITDNTEHKRALELFRQAQKGESLARMAGGIAHDFNNLFQALQSNLEVAQATLLDPERQTIALGRAIKIMARAAVLSSKMLDYSGKGFFHSEGVNLGQLLRLHEDTLRELGGSHCGLVFAMDDPLPEIAGDPHQLLQVMIALVANASEAIAPNPGLIQVSVRLHHVQGEELQDGYWPEPARAGDYVTLSVEDDGCGMAPETLLKAFDPFFTTKTQGRGLGLSSALGILRAHHGCLQLKSAPGEGTRVQCFFPPRINLAEATASESLCPARESGQKTLLLVDDDEDLRTTLVEILGNMLGYAVLQAGDGMEGVAAFRKGPDRIDLVLMDATMPRMNGLEAFKLIKEVRPSAKALLCSGFSEAMGLAEAEKHGFCGFLKKPFSIKTLQEAVEKALER